MRTIFITAVVDDSDQMHDALMKFHATRFKKDSQQVLFVYNIGEPIDPSSIQNLQESKFLCIHNAEPLPEIVAEYDLKDGKIDYSTRREVAVPGQAYGKDYLRATADAGKVAEKLIEQLGFEVAFDDFKFYNFFNKPKISHAAKIKSQEIESLKGFQKESGAGAV